MTRFYLIYFFLVFIPCCLLSKKLFPGFYSKYRIPKITKRYLDAIRFTRLYNENYKLQKKGDDYHAKAK